MFSFLTERQILIGKRSWRDGGLCSLIFIFVIAIFALLGVHSLDTAWTTTAIRRFEREVDVFLRVQANDEAWNIYQLLTDPDVPLSDENAGVMNGFGQSEFK